jgi:phospholipase C
MLENRSFDHLFGFSGLTGFDATSGAPTSIDGLTGQESNMSGGTTYRVTRDASLAAPHDPPHEFLDIVRQLCGSGAVHVPPAPYDPYPAIDSSGFVDSYRQGRGVTAPGEIMKCFDTPRQLPVLYALAQEFALCDRWFSSLPGPTWPNRMFAHAASAGGLDHSPSVQEILVWEEIDGFAFKNGSIFQALAAAGKTYCLYSGDAFPMVAALKGIHRGDVRRIDALVADLQRDPFPYDYVFIEPSYDLLHDYRASDSHHPLGDVRAGEKLVKTVYEALRASTIWEKSLLAITWDEHGGFYDHVKPPGATPPGDTTHPSNTKYGFAFAQYGVRVPALIVSPFVPRSTIDHRLYDHASLPATVEATFGLGPLTERDNAALNLLPLLSLEVPRQCPMRLPEPVATAATVAVAASRVAAPAVPVPAARPTDPVDDGSLPAIVHAAMRAELERYPERKQAILDRVRRLKTRADAQAYLREVRDELTDAPGPSTP